jgi:hypothetical protein
MPWAVAFHPVVYYILYTRLVACVGARVGDPLLPSLYLDSQDRQEAPLTGKRASYTRSPPRKFPPKSGFTPEGIILWFTLLTLLVYQIQHVVHITWVRRTKRPHIIW